MRCMAERLVVLQTSPEWFSPTCQPSPRPAVDVLASARFPQSGSATGSSQCRIPLLPPLQMLGDCSPEQGLQSGEVRALCGCGGRASRLACCGMGSLMVVCVGALSY